MSSSFFFLLPHPGFSFFPCCCCRLVLMTGSSVSLKRTRIIILATWHHHWQPLPPLSRRRRRLGQDMNTRTSWRSTFSTYLLSTIHAHFCSRVKWIHWWWVFIWWIQWRWWKWRRYDDDSWWHKVNAIHRSHTCRVQSASNTTRGDEGERNYIWSWSTFFIWAKNNMFYEQ